MDIAAVPDSIKLSQIREIVSSLGIDPDQTATIRFGREAVEAKVYALDVHGLNVGNGNRFCTTDEDGEAVAAMHTIMIPVINDLED